MVNETTLAFAGFTMILLFMYLIMSKRMSAMNVLILIPVIFAIGVGFYDTRLGTMMMAGVIKVAPTGIMICFAILFFGIMIDAGLFDPVIEKILKAVHGDPMKVCVGTALLAAFISLDGDGSTTYLVTCSAILAVHRRLGINAIILPALAVLENSVMNIIPWGGPTSRVLASLGVESSQVFLPMIPCMVVGTLFVCFMGYLWGLNERNRIGIIDFTHDGRHAVVSGDPEADKLKRPEKIWFNFALTALLMFCLIMETLPLAILFIIGTAFALLINYKNKDQQARICANGANAMPVISMVFASGIFMGILSGTKMVDAMSNIIVAAVPETMGAHFPLITALISLPGTFFMTNDAFYFGVLPVLTKAAAIYGIPAAEMGRAALIGQGAHLLSPLVPSTFLLVGLNKVELGDLQKFALIPAICISLLWLATSIVLGHIRI
ncbi:MAG: CitMHS family transporter [Candidatus Methylumidiphilus sp.]